MDDETAEIELLEQNLNKTRQISKRMISILDSFDTRLAKLEKSILPLYTSAQVLNKRTNNIDQTLLKIDEVATNQDDLVAEETLILRGPQPGQFVEYMDALERLNANIAFKGSESDMTEAAQLVETGAKKLTQLYTQVVAEGSSGSTPAPGSEWPSSTFPPSLLSELSPVVAFLRTLPMPSTHPSHPAAASILGTLKDAQRGYADMRGNWNVKCLEGQGKRLVVRADTLDPIVTGREFGDWVQLMLNVADDEYTLLKELSPLSSPPSIASAYGTLLTPILKLFSSTLSLLIVLVKKSLQKYNFLALSAYESLLSLQPQWEDMISHRGPDYPDDKNSLKDGLQSLRAICLRSFPEFLADLKMGSMSKGADTSVKLTDFNKATVNYLSRIPEVKSAVTSALVALGDGNWKMGEGVQVGKGAKPGEGDESILLDHFIYDVVTTTITSLTTLARVSRRHAFGSIFLLNNISYLRQHLLLQPKYSELLDLISPAAQDAINSNYRTAKAGYFDSNFSPLMQAITDDPKDKYAKGVAKEKFTRFFDILDEVIERHKLSKVLEDDPQGKEALGGEVVMLVIPSLQRFTQKQKDKEFSKNPQKYIKMTPDEVEKQLKKLYTG